jgi:uncharacterized phage-associated protein
MRLQKLLYYVQAWHLAVTDEPLFSEQIKAWRAGPVVPQVWHARREQETRRSSNQDVESITVDDLTSDLIDLVVAAYGSMSGEELSALTHVEQPWLEARGVLRSDEEGRAPISLESMATFYRAHRRLGDRTASDLAAGGLYVRASRHNETIDVDSIIASLDSKYWNLETDLWGGANLNTSEHFDAEDIQQTHRRSYTGA